MARTEIKLIGDSSNLSPTFDGVGGRLFNRNNLDRADDLKINRIFNRYYNEKGEGISPKIGEPYPDLYRFLQEGSEYLSNSVTTTTSGGGLWSLYWENDVKQGSRIERMLKYVKDTVPLKYDEPEQVKIPEQVAKTGGTYDVNVKVGLENDTSEYNLFPKPVDGGEIFADFYYDDSNDEITTIKDTDHSIDSSSPSISGLLQNTLRFFREGRINSMVSKLEKTLPDNTIVSRGRKLPTRNGGELETRRVWSNTKNYNTFKDTMSRIRNYGSDDDPLTNKQIADNYWVRPFRTSHGANDIDTNSVMSEHGTPRITPTHDNDNSFEKYNDVSRCMFSIENLAWRDINPKANVDRTGQPTLSPEQRGPNGGRIMWFPPYGLTFSEQASTQWDQNQFIGRGEKIYTYTNTERRGSLSFFLLVDHPSILDSWGYNRTGVSSAKDEDEAALLRYLAGIEMPKDEGMKSTIKPEETEPEKTVDTEEKPEEITETRAFAIFFPNNYSGKDDTPDGILQKLWGSGYEDNAYEQDKNGITIDYGDPDVEFTYWVDDENKKQKLDYENNYHDTSGFSLNNVVGQDEDIKKMIRTEKLSTDSEEIGDISSLVSYLQELKEQTQDSEITVSIHGMASSHGNWEKNLDLANNRAYSIKKLIDSIIDINDDNFIILNNINLEDSINDVGTDKNVSTKNSKFARRAIVRIGIIRKSDKPNLDVADGHIGISGIQDAKDVTPHPERVRYEAMSEDDARFLGHSYDNEYAFFKMINDDDDFLPYKKSLVSKIQYFDPAFHSITPEGFNARLTFLHQCTRQGPTHANSDKNGGSWTGAGNMSFGRPPFCILRIGDFFYTKILIESMNITYDNSGGVQWDLNRDGIGIQPMFAKIDLNFVFLGGQDISGPVARLQNAVSYNFYANTSIYDIRADYRGSVSNNEAAATGKDVVDEADNIAAHRPWTTSRNGKNDTVMAWSPVIVSDDDPLPISDNVTLTPGDEMDEEVETETVPIDEIKSQEDFGVLTRIQYDLLNDTTLIRKFNGDKNRRQ